jgi:D-lactate dehydrogenase
VDVFFYEAFEEETAALKRHLGTRIKAGFDSGTIQETGSDSPRARVVSIRTQSVIPQAWAGSIDGILTRSSGYDHVEAYLKGCGMFIPCGYLPRYCRRAVAEQAAMLWLALLRKLPDQMASFSRFNRDGLTGSECEGGRLLVVGVGNIGLEVVRIGRSLGMEVLGVDIVQRHESVSYVSIDEGLRLADVVICAMNLTDDNRGYFDHDLLKTAKPGMIFVNIARGELSPSAGLARLLDEGVLGGVGLDVYNQESLLAGHLRDGCAAEDGEVRATLELARRPNVILTPHNAFNTREAVENKAVQSVQQVRCFLAEGRFKWPVPLQAGIQADTKGTK